MDDEHFGQKGEAVLLKVPLVVPPASLAVGKGVDRSLLEQLLDSSLRGAVEIQQRDTEIVDLDASATVEQPFPFDYLI